MRELDWNRVAGFSSVAALLFGLAACGSPANNSALFSASGATTGGPASGGSASEVGGGGASGSGAAAGASNGGATLGGSAGDHSLAGSTNGGSTLGGAAGSTVGGVGGAAGSAMGGSAGSAMGGTSNAGNGGSGMLNECPQNASATLNPENQHCYLAVHDLATFADARTHCASMSAHLVTLSSQQENDFVWQLDTSEHWIGATDGKNLKQPAVGIYTWIDGEPFTYMNWSAGQPNATPTACSDPSGPGMFCYEHCAFQWSGGANPGEWNDRLCSHTIEAVCEWDG